MSVCKRDFESDMNRFILKQEDLIAYVYVCIHIFFIRNNL